MKVLKVKSFADLVESKTWLVCYVLYHILIGWICTTMKERAIQEHRQEVLSS